MNIPLNPLWLLFGALITFSCTSVNKSINYKRLPKSYSEVQAEYENYHHFAGCQPGETIASIGAGNGKKEIQISCVVEGITWHLQEIDSTRLYQFDEVLAYHQNLLTSPIDADFNLVLGTEDTTNLTPAAFDRVLLLNVFHEIEARKGIMTEITQLLNKSGELVIMERMGTAEGQIHGDCKYPKLVEPSFLQEMDNYGYTLKNKQLAEEMSNLMFYTFSSKK